MLNVLFVSKLQPNRFVWTNSIELEMKFTEMFLNVMIQCFTFILNIGQILRQC